jgi:hypothetical protein
MHVVGRGLERALLAHPRLEKLSRIGEVSPSDDGSAGPDPEQQRHS